MSSLRLLSDTHLRVKRFFPSEYGADPNLPFIKETPFLASKVAVREYLLEKAKQGLIEYTSIASGATHPLLAMPIRLTWI